MRFLARLVREPLVHFLAIGGSLFLIYAAAGGPRPVTRDVIVVEPGQIERLVAGFESVWRRPPSVDERRALIDDFIREEIYYREALALGLDRDDAIVRRRLRQKMEFLSDSGAELLQPADGELEAHLAANAQRFGREPRLTIEQIYLGESPAPATIARSLWVLASDPGADPSRLSAPTVLPPGLGPSSPGAIDAVFGRGVFDRFAALPTGIWSGPVESAYGVHIVRVLDAIPASTPVLDEVRDAVLIDWKAAKAQQIRDLHYARLRERFSVEIRDAGPQVAKGP